MAGTVTHHQIVLMLVVVRVAPSIYSSVHPLASLSRSQTPPNGKLSLFIFCLRVRIQIKQFTHHLTVREFCMLIIHLCTNSHLWFTLASRCQPMVESPTFQWLRLK